MGRYDEWPVDCSIFIFLLFILKKGTASLFRNVSVGQSRKSFQVLLRDDCIIVINHTNIQFNIHVHSSTDTFGVNRTYLCISDNVNNSVSMKALPCISSPFLSFLTKL